MIIKDGFKYLVIDAHLHLPWKEEYPTIESKYIQLKSEMKRNGIDHGLIIADSVLDTDIGTNQQVYDVVKNDSSLSMLYGFSILERYEEQLQELKDWLNDKKVKGVKLYPGHEDFSMNDIRLDRVIELCVKYDVPVAIHTEWNADCYPQYSHPFYINQIAEKYPDLKIVCCHIWSGRTLKSLKETINNKNIFYDISSFIASNEYRKQYPNVFPTMEAAIKLLEEVVELVPNRVMFGSDFGSLEISDHIEMIKQSNISRDKLELLLSKNAQRIYGT